MLCAKKTLLYRMIYASKGCLVTYENAADKLIACASQRKLSFQKLAEDRVPASMQGELQPTVYRFKFGNFEIANILDGKVVRDGLHPSFGPEHSAEEAQSAVRRSNGIEANRYVHPFIPTLVNTGSELILFDTGNGALRRDYRQLRAAAVGRPPGRTAWRRPAISRRTSTSS